MRPTRARLAAGQALVLRDLIAINRDRPAVAKHRATLAGAVAAFLAARAAAIADQVIALLGLGKARRRPGGDAEAIAAAAARARKALDALEFGDEWLALVSAAEKPLSAMAADGGLAALQQLGVQAEDVRALAGDKAAAWGRARAAEMVGMRRNAAGGLVPNPGAKWRIDDSTREMLRTVVEAALTEGQSADDLKAAILDSHAFSAERAESIARTEIAKADMAGTMEGYRASGLVAGKYWSTAQDEQVSEECVACEEAGVIGLDKTFPSGEDAPPNHPNCRCTVLPVLTDEMPEKAQQENPMTKLYAAITKAEKQDDGTVKVYGYASSEVVDSDGETITADAMKAARDGYMAFANVREMHDPKKAAGVAIEYEVQDDGKTWFGAHVVDPVAVLKVETGVYKGFSIGARVPAGGRDGKVIKAIELREVSLVDRPANPEAVFTMFKADGAADDEQGGSGELQKGLYTAKNLIDALAIVRGCCADAEYEAKYGGHSADVVAEMKGALSSIGAIAQRYLGEEIAAMLAPAADAAKAASEADLEKAGRRFSAATKAALKAAHEACKAADKALADLGYDADGDQAGQADGDDDAKAAKAAAEADLAKRAADEARSGIEEVAKAAGLTLPEPTPQALTKAALSALVDLRREHAELLASPAAPKGVAKVAAISKAADLGGEKQEPAPVLKADGAVDDVATLIKAAQAAPIRIA